MKSPTGQFFCDFCGEAVVRGADCKVGPDGSACICGGCMRTGRPPAESTSAPDGEVTIVAAVFSPNGLTVTLKNAVGNFWMNLGPCWGLFVSRAWLFNEPHDASEEVYLLADMRPASAPPPHPISSSLNVLWRKWEALEALRRELAYRSDPASYVKSTAQET